MNMDTEIDIDRRAGEDWPAEGMEKLGHCPTCGSTAFEDAHTDCRDVVFGAAGGTWTLRRCTACGSGFLDPRPTPQAIGAAYKVYYTHESRLPPARRGGGLKYALLERIRGSYINARYGRGRPSLGWLGRLIAHRLPADRATLDSTHRFVPFPHQVPAPRLLDLGCGNGDFLRIASMAGWTSFGSDPDPSALKIADALGAEIRQGGIEVWNDRDTFFDTITMNHVVEHLHDPVEDLRRCFALLKPGGRIYIETPNFDAYGHQMYGPFWRGLEVPRHLTIFTWASLRGALEACGFEIEREVVRDNFVKQARRSAKAEVGVFDFEDIADDRLRMPSETDIAEARRDPRRSEWIGLLARRPATSAA